MKKHLLSLLLLILTLSVQAKDVTVQQVKDVAVQYINNRSPHKVSVRDIQTASDGKGSYYVVNLAPQGWVIVAGDDVVKPIIGYSYTGNLSLKQLPENMEYMLNSLGTEIKRISAVVQEAHPYWKSAGYLTTRASKSVIEPLIKVTWNQSAPYNIYCPKRGDERALVGCVAVAMSQAMSVQHYPARPKGNVSYTAPYYGGLKIDFDAERAYNWNDILSGSNNFDEAARLLYHAGMSVRMDYGVDASGIPSNEVSRISNALKNNFSYPDDVQYLWREHYDGDWNQLLINELRAGRAIIYNAIDTKNSAGHSFNLDGYDGEGHFHVNWGWGGYGNAYFSIDNLRDSAMNMDYDAGHVAVIGIGAADQILKGISLSSNHIEEGQPAGAVVGQVLVNNEPSKATYTVTVSGVNGKNVPFTVENGMLKTTEVLQVAACAQWDMEITVNDSESNTSLTQGIQVLVDVWKSLEETTSVSFDRISNKFSFITKHNVTYTLTGEQGQVLGSGSLEPLPQLEIDAASLPSGKNMLTLKCVDETISIQLITK